VVLGVYSRFCNRCIIGFAGVLDFVRFACGFLWLDFRGFRRFVRLWVWWLYFSMFVGF